MDECAQETPSSPLLNVYREYSVPPAMSGSSKVFTAAIAIASITIGSVYFSQCKAQHLIPYYLIISGISSLVIILLTSLPCGDGRDPPQTSPAILALQGIFTLFHLAFFIAGNVWIYSIYAPEYTDTASPEYCHKGLYLYAFWITTLVYILLGITLLAGCCILVCFCACRAATLRGMQG
ncbi:transmembrane protein 272-like [Ambystoma mexicanum]|uniref:transmembrane protein 272-like n=1 Tax=Ambystoma mexicanum TaxID=8296 RepID=UPI0037E74983